MLTSLVYLQKGNFKKSKKLIKLVNTDEESLHIFQTIWGFSNDCFWRSNLFLIVNIEKIKIRITKYTSTKVYRRNHYPKHVFSWVLLNPRTTDLLSNQPPVLTHQPTMEVVVQQNSRMQLPIAWWSLALALRCHVENEVQHWWYNVAFRHNATLIM